MTPHTFELTDFDSKFSGNVIEICPVGALTSAKYRFRARPWDLETRPSICTECSNGCATWFDYRVDQVVRINGRTNEAVNEEWTCDRGKFGHDYLNSPDRLTSVFVRDGEQHRESTWSEAYELLLPHFKGGSAAALTGNRPSNEDLFLFKKLFGESFDSTDIDSRWYVTSSQFNKPTTPIASIEKAKTLVVFGGSLADEQPIVFLRVRKAATQNGAKVVVVSKEPQEADAFASQSIRYQTGGELETARNLKTDAETVVIASRSLFDLPNGNEVVTALDALPGTLTLYATEANEQGALDIGVTSGDTTRILEDCRDGKIKALWLLQCDPFEKWHDKELVRNALENVEFLVVQDIAKTEAFDYASVVLPTCAFSERDGSYTNCERRVQFVNAIIAPKGVAKPAWKVFGELQMRLGSGAPPFNAREVFEMLASETPAFAGATFEQIQGDGWPLEMQSAAGERAYARV